MRVPAYMFDTDWDDSRNQWCSQVEMFYCKMSKFDIMRISVLPKFLPLVVDMVRVYDKFEK